MSHSSDPSADPLPGIDLGPEQFQHEKETLFCRAWLPFCLASQLTEPGRYVGHTLGGWPLVVIAGADRIIRGFRNRCRHQNMPLLDQPVGDCREIRCRFHGWVYDLAGAFMSAPDSVAPPSGRAAAETHLEPVEVARSGDFIFVRQRSSAEAPAEWPLLPFPHFDTVSTDIDANWKSVVESVLATGATGFLWPTAFIAEAPDKVVVHQIVPRSFARTRVVDYLFAPSDQASLMLALRAAAIEGKATAEAYNAGLAANGTIVAFRRRIADSTRET